MHPRRRVSKVADQVLYLEIQSLKVHLDNSCLKQDIKCPFDGCESIFPREDISEHIKECDCKSISCEHCSIMINLKTLIYHYEVCPKIEINCPFDCGVIIKRESLDSHLISCENKPIDCPLFQFGCNHKIFYPSLFFHYLQLLYNFYLNFR